MTAPDLANLTTRFSAEEWHGRKPAYASGGPLQIPPEAPMTFTEALRRRAQETGNGVLYVQKDGQEDFQSYAALWQEARQILTGLRKLGLRPRDRVILQIDNLRNHFTTFWACVLGGFTPVTVAVAPSYADKNGVVNKLFNTWKLLKSPLIITSTHLESAILGLMKILPMEGLRTTPVEPLKANEPADEVFESRPEDLVFFQLTSGSTGVPKCIQETHRGIIHHIHGAQQFNGYTAEDVTLNWLPVDHVVPILTSHLKDVYIGARQIHVKADVVLHEPLRWLDLMEKHRVTHSWSPNFGFKLVADRLAQTSGRHWNLHSIKFLMNAGEQVTLPVVSDFLERTKPFGIQPQVMQPAFGMAEVCTCMTYQNDFDVQTGARRFTKHSLSGLMELAEEDDRTAVTFVDLGPPVPGVEIRITDQENKLVPEGVVGRFQIRGAVVTPGYLYNDAANQEAFVGDGWFNSGDLGFIWDGRLTLTGREKEMIIVRGANFYCYEIEDVVNQIEGVEPTFVGSCAVANAESGTEGLAIFFVPKPSHTWAEDGSASPALLGLVRQIKTRVAASLGINPSFLIPLEKNTFPKTTSGKIQRSQMKKNFEAGDYSSLVDKLNQAAGSASTEKSGAQDPLEQRVAGIWQEMLRVNNVGRGDNFFELGGDSLTAARVIARVTDAFKVELPLHVLFNGGGTVRGMAEHIRKSGETESMPPLTRRTESHRAPASFGQQRLWLADQLSPGTPAYNVGSVIRLAGVLDRDALRQALQAIAERHEVWRARFEVADNSIWQRFDSRIDFNLHETNVPGASANEVFAAAHEEVARLFDLSQGPLVRSRLFQTGPEESYLVLSLHQAVTDGWSLGVLYRELAAFYGHFSAGQPLNLPELPNQFGDYAAWQRQHLTHSIIEPQMRYWRGELAGTLAEIELPIDLPRPAAQTFSGDTIVQRLAPEASETLRQFCRENGITTYMALMGAYQAFLSRLSGQDQVLLGTAIAGRNRTELENMMGFFVNTVAMRADLAANPSFKGLAQQTREKTLAAYANQQAPFEKIVEELQPARNHNRPPIFQVWFGAWDPLPEYAAGQLTIKPVRVLMGGAQFELSLFAIDDPKGIELIWEYRTDLFARASVLRFSRIFENLLRRLVGNPEDPIQTIFAALAEDEYREQLEESSRMRQSLKTARRKGTQVAG